MERRACADSGGSAAANSPAKFGAKAVLIVPIAQKEGENDGQARARAVIHQPGDRQ